MVLAEFLYDYLGFKEDLYCFLFSTTSTCEAGMCTCPQRPIGSPEDGVTGACEPLNMGTGN